MSEDFASDVRQQIERFQTTPLRTIERQVAEKRIKWFYQTRQRVETSGRPTPRQAYELLFFDFMGLSRDELPVLSESDDEIVWQSLNPCDTLEACKSLGLDTRNVCRAAYEKSTQALISQLDPRLRFLRSYEAIRPHAEHCKEWIVRVDFERMMDAALEEALISKREGYHGYGAVVTLGNRIISKASDTFYTGKDPSLHAEVKAIRGAVQEMGDSNLSGAILFSTCEPCPMCASLAVWANLSAIVYGASIEETAQLGRPRIMVSAKEIVARSPVMMEVIGGIHRERCLQLYADPEEAASAVLEASSAVPDHGSQVEKETWKGHEILFGMMYEFIETGEALLDIGIGTGVSSILFHDMGLVVSGFDFSPEMVEGSKAKGFSGDLSQHDLRNVPYPYESDSFDHILSLEVLNYFGDLAPTIHEVSRIVKPGGVFGFTIERQGPDEEAQYTLQVDGEEEAVTLYRHSDAHIRSLLEGAGFTVLKDHEFLADRYPAQGNEAYLTIYVARKKASFG